MAEIILNAKARESKNKGANRQLRRDGRIPGVYYAKNTEPVLFDVAENSVKPLVYTSETHIVSLQVEGKEPFTCILKEYQMDPVTEKIVHFDLQGVQGNEMLKVEVPVSIVGNAAGIKQGGILQQVLHKLEVECLPMYMPEHLEINVVNLNLGESIHVRDLKFENLTLLNASDAVVISVVTPRTEKEVTAEAGEPEVIAKGKVDKEG